MKAYNRITTLLKTIRMKFSFFETINLGVSKKEYSGGDDVR